MVGDVFTVFTVSVAGWRDGEMWSTELSGHWPPVLMPLPSTNSSDFFTFCRDITCNKPQAEDNKQFSTSNMDERMKLKYFLYI